MTSPVSDSPEPSEKTQLVEKGGRTSSYVPHKDGMATARVCRYETKKLGTWRTFSYTFGTVWRTVELWKVVFHLVVTSMIIAVVAFIIAERVGPVNTARFSTIADTFKVIVAFLLGYYLTSSVKRWGETVDGFLIVFNTARSLNTQLHALGVSNEWIEQISRYAILSARFLSMELQAKVARSSGDAEAQGAMDENASVAQLYKEQLLGPAEAATLHKVSDHPSLLWVWVALVIGKLAQNGEVPGMASPTYGRLMNLTQTAQTGIRKVYVSMTVQMPFVYVHMLAMLVHINNIICAITFGCTLGNCLASILAIHGTHLFAEPASRAVVNRDATVQSEVQIVVLSFITSFAAPLLYQAALQIGLCLAQPFNSEIADIPTAALIAELQRDLAHAKIMANSLPGFEKPFFKAPAQTV